MLTPQEADVLFETLREMAAEGRTVIFISHKLHEVKAVADRVTVLRGGRSVATVDDGGRDAALARGADGRPRAARQPRPASERRRRATPCSSSKSVWAQGDRGDGGRRGRLARASARARSSPSRASPATGSASSPRRSPGCAPPTAGAVRVGGQPLRGGDPRAAIAAGVAYVPEDRLGTGVAPSLSIASNLVLKSYRGRRRRAGRCSGCGASASGPSS